MVDMRGQLAAATFSATGRMRKAPPALRSAGRKPTPCAMASVGFSKSAGAPSTAQFARIEVPDAEG